MIETQKMRKAITDTIRHHAWKVGQERIEKENHYPIPSPSTQPAFSHPSTMHIKPAGESNLRIDAKIHRDESKHGNHHSRPQQSRCFSLLL